MTDKLKKNETGKENQSPKPTHPEPETLHRTDPQEHMEGPVSSLIHKTGEQFDSNETKDEADQRKEENI